MDKLMDVPKTIEGHVDCIQNIEMRGKVFKPVM
jgi:hypothetical protein